MRQVGHLPEVRDQVSHPCKTTWWIIVLHILIFILLGKQTILHRMIASSPWVLYASHYFMDAVLIVRPVTKYLDCSTLWKYLSPIFRLWFCSAFWSRDMNVYDTYFSQHLRTSRPTSLLATNNVTVLLFM